MPYDIQDFTYDASLNGTRGIYAPASSRRRPSAIRYRDYGKRALDLLLVVASLPIVLPLIVLMAVLVAMDGHAPFYTQDRVGRDGRRFRILKMRTMIPNAEKVLHMRLAADTALRAEWTATQKLKNDFRITWIGRVLRKSSFDELPQLWNVLNGSMSLVGPRPMMPSQQTLYSGTAYYRLRPGITGFWQISDRNDCDFRDRAIFDDAYDREISLATDLKVLIRTVSVVLRGTGH